jgi:hypothetical protein
MYSDLVTCFDQIPAETRGPDEHRAEDKECRPYPPSRQNFEEMRRRHGIRPIIKRQRHVIAIPHTG